MEITYIYNKKDYIDYTANSYTVERFKLACLAKLTWSASFLHILNRCTIYETAMIRRAFQGELIYFLVK